jgi:hypothetical protein
MGLPAFSDTTWRHPFVATDYIQLQPRRIPKLRLAVDEFDCIRHATFPIAGEPDAVRQSRGSCMTTSATLTRL